jgi:hypothetical protein
VYPETEKSIGNSHPPEDNHTSIGSTCLDVKTILDIPILARISDGIVYEYAVVCVCACWLENSAGDAVINMISLHAINNRTGGYVWSGLTLWGRGRID